MPGLISLSEECSGEYVLGYRGADLRIVLSLAVWMLSVGLTYLVGDIAYSSDIDSYINMADLTPVYIVGGLMIALVYALWYMLRRENRLLDIAGPVCVLAVWGLARRKVLYAGGNGMIYSIAFGLKKTYGIKTGMAEIDYVSVEAIAEFVLFATAIVMFFSAYMIYRCNSIMIAVALSFLVIASGAAISVHVRPQGIVLTVLALIITRYILMRKGQLISPVWNVAIPVVALVLCITSALLIYENVYDSGIKKQGKLLELIDNIEYFVMGENGKGYSKYYKIDDSEVNPTDEVVDEITRKEKPDGNLYVKVRSYVVYEDGTWHNRDTGLSPDDKTLVEYDKEVFSRYESELNNITGGHQEFSDEVMNDIVTYIDDHMSYTTSPGKFAAGEDPVMYALYTGHQGYCIHFATAAAVGFRTVGIPTRYNTGYVVPSSAWVRQANGTYRASILDKYSHAWIEAYDSSADNWTIVDATPLGDRADVLDIPQEPDKNSGNNDENITSETLTTEADISTEISTEQVTSETEITDSEVTTEAEPDSTEDRQISGTGDADSSTGANAGDGNGTGLEQAGHSKAFYIVICTILILLAAASVLWWRRRITVLRRHQRLTGRNRINAVYEMSALIYDMLCFAGMIDKVSPDDMEYADAVTQQCRMIKGDEFRSFIACVQAAVYGQHEPDDEQMKAARRLYNKVRAYSYWSLNLRGKFRWSYVRCFDPAPRRKKKHVRKE